jgi:hypothetical protein
MLNSISIFNILLIILIETDCIISHRFKYHKQYNIKKFEKQWRKKLNKKYYLHHILLTTHIIKYLKSKQTKLNKVIFLLLI